MDRDAERLDFCVMYWTRLDSSSTFVYLEWKRTLSWLNITRRGRRLRNSPVCEQISKSMGIQGGSMYESPSPYNGG